jgi:hypothetical protein
MLPRTRTHLDTHPGFAVDKALFMGDIATAGQAHSTGVAEPAGLRVCFYMVLCVGSKLRGDHRLAKRYYYMARASTSPAYQQPTQHLVSALLLMTILTRSVCRDAAQAALHAVLAKKVADSLSKLTPEVRGSSSCADSGEYVTFHRTPPL